jgi:hypothetical protein
MQGILDFLATLLANAVSGKLSTLIGLIAGALIYVYNDAVSRGLIDSVGMAPKTAMIITGAVGFLTALLGALHKKEANDL